MQVPHACFIIAGMTGIHRSLGVVSPTCSTLGLLTFATAFGVLASQADIVQFDQASQSGDPIHVDGVTISGAPMGPSGQPVTVQGLGLGSSTIGPADSIDWLLHFSAGSFNPDSNLSEGLSLSVDGAVHSVTLIPECTILGTGESVDIPFQAMIYPLAHAPGTPGTSPLMPEWVSLDPASPTPLIYTGRFNSDDISAFMLNLIPAGDPVVPLYPYLSDHGFPDVTFQFSVRVTALDYSPVAVPEPTVMSLVGLGVLGLGWTRWRRSCA